ncbi:MAG: sugar phosphate isomerase/epimerase [Clostridiales bacterium]|nr:sugar phosphate isomerase/epimerase [Clostridiales bacterium]
MPVFGMPTLIEAPSPEESALLCKELGLSFVELNMNLPHYQPQTFPLSALKKLTRDQGLFFTLHLDENFNPCDFNPHIADAWLRTLEETLQLAQELECPLINLHLSRGVYFTLPGKREFLYERYRAVYLRSLERVIALCEKSPASGKIKIAIENTNGFLPFQLEGLRLLLQSPIFCLTYDTGHDFEAGHTDRDFLLSRKDRLVHMHLHDASPKGCHLPLGEGLVDKIALLELARETESTVVLETKTITGLRRSVDWLREMT